MSDLNLLFTVLSAIILFLFGLQGFSRELRGNGGNKLREWLSRLTSHRLAGFGLGVVATVLLQSSTAVSSILVSFVDAGVITFRDSLAVLIGSKVGTTSTAWLVSLKVEGLGPLFIVLGTLIGFLPWKIKTLGKAFFYFGFIFFSLDLISESLEPVKRDPRIVESLSYASNHYLGVLIGTLVTIIVQSSSVVAGLTVVLVQQGLLGAEEGIPLVIGAGLGTTTTALIVAAQMRQAAKRAALANFMVNLIALLLFLPFLDMFSAFVVAVAPEGMEVAIAQLLFASIAGLFFMIFLTPFSEFIERLYKPHSS